MGGGLQGKREGKNERRRLKLLLQRRALTGEGEKKDEKEKRKKEKKGKKKGEQEAGEKDMFNAFRVGLQCPPGRLVTDSHPCKKDNTSAVLEYYSTGILQMTTHAPRDTVSKHAQR